jgi:hypothetical protein
MKRFTVEEIEKYILSQDSLGDVLHYLSEEAIEKANDTVVYDDELVDEGWECPASPTGYCDYTQEDGSFDEDCCIYCGEPEERK